MPTSGTIRCDDAEIQIQRGGAGAPLLFLHDAYVGAAWLPVHDRLAQRCEIVLPQHPGYGGGDPPPWLERVADLANFYLDLIGQLKFRRVHLVGAALGGWIAAELAVRDSSRLASLTLIAPWGLRVDGLPGIDPFLATDEQALRGQFSNRDASDPLIVKLLAPESEDALLKGKTVTAKLAWQPRLHDPHLGKWLRRIDVPTLVVWGEEDRLLPPGFGAAWQRAIASARLVPIAGAGHLAHIDQPERVAGAIIDFIAQQRDAA